MCGRAVQQASSVLTAASILGCHPKNLSNSDSSEKINMSPGRTFIVFQKHSNPSSEESKGNEKIQLCSTEKVWGLINRKGTPNSPLPTGPSKHFSNLMFNARSETAAEKPSFRNLITTSKSCILPLNGYYEWKTPSKDTVGNNGKQPYYVHRSDAMPLFVAGLYTVVSTGYAEKDELHTFTMLTTSACPQLRWLHHRMPVLLWDETQVKKWIDSPTPQLLDELASIANSTANHPNLTWYPVTKKMSNVQYDGMDSINPIKLEKLPSIKSFFGKNSMKPSMRNSTIKTGSKMKAMAVRNEIQESSKKSSFFSNHLSKNTTSKRSDSETYSNTTTSETSAKRHKSISCSDMSSSTPGSSKKSSSSKSKRKRDITSYFNSR